MVPHRSSRLHASAVHLLLSLLVALAAAAVVFAVWYPWPYRVLAGGQTLFLIVVVVDVVMGPVLTFVVFSPRKPRAELRRDLGIIVLLQLAALAYGMWSVAQARPVYLVFEVDRLRVVSVADIDPALLDRAPGTLGRLPWTGPVLIGATVPPATETLISMQMTMAGLDVALRPWQWTRFDTVRADAVARARPLPELIAALPQEAAQLEKAARDAQRPPQALAYLPILARGQAWTALVDPITAEPLAYAPVDPFER